MRDNYTVLHLHTENSLLDSCTNYKLYIDKAVELKQKAIAFTEHGNIYNWVEKKMYANKNGLKYIHGVECYLTETLDEKVRDNYHTILLAKNYKGFQEINKLLDVATQEDHFYYKPRITFDEFFNISNNVIKISACLASPLKQYPGSKNHIQKRINELTNEHISYVSFMEKNKEDIGAFHKWVENKLQELIDGSEEGEPKPEFPWKDEEEAHIEYCQYINCLILTAQNEHTLEIERLNKQLEDAKIIYDKLLKTYDYYEIQPHNFREQKEYNEFLYTASKKYNKKLIVGTDTHSVSQYKAECRSILQKAKRIQYSNEDSFDLTYKNYYELIEMFKKQNSNIPFDVILAAIEETNVVADMVEDFELDLSFKYPKLYDDEETVLKQRIIRMLKEKLEKGIIDDDTEYKKNIIEEFKVFKKINMVGFMLFMSELVTWCWDNDIPIGFCRGSVGGSTIAYVTDIIDVDPIKWKTVFSRFANEDRIEIGDIDIDIAPSQRHLVYEHIIETFGKDNTAYILAMGTISDKGTIDEIGRALEIPLEEVALIKSEYEADPLKTIEKYPRVFYYFDGLLGTVVSQSMHPAGIVVSPVTLPDNYGTFWSDGKRILCINMEECHEVSLVKYDLLGLKNIEIIHKTCQYAGIKYPKSHEIDWNDSKVWKDLIKSPVGIFQFEGDYAFSLLKNFQPTCVNDLSLCNAALRPSGASYRDKLLARIPNQNPSKLIDELLAENNGYLVFQEDTIKFLKDICGLSGSDADNVRRAIGRKQVDRLQKALPQILDGYCKMSSQPREVAEQEAKAFLQIIEDSSNYQFGYNHSTGYSMIGYTCAYLRYYFPVEFITAYLNCANNSDDIKTGTALAKMLGIKINSIRFGKSGSDYTVDKKNNAIYKGISSIKYCNSKIANELYLLSKNEYKNFVELLYDIKSNTSLDSRQLNILTGLNFFEMFGGNKYLLEVIDLFNKFSSCKQIKKDKMEELGLSDYLMKKYAGKETAKIYKELDNRGLLSELMSRIDNKSLSVVDQVKFEMEYLEYCIYKNTRVNEKFYIVIEYKHFKDITKPYITLHNIKTGEDIKTRIKVGKIYKQNPFGLYSVLKIQDFAEHPKKKCINGEWVSTDELEPILECYEVIK